MQLVLLETGGTINGLLAPGESRAAPSRVAAWLEGNRSRLGIQFAHERVCWKDSRDIDRKDRENLCGAIERWRCERVLVPHGTYTMPETGKYLRARLARADRPLSIVLVGSLVPLGEPGSDAPQTLELALATLLSGEKPGVWIAMQGRLWDPTAVVKDPVTGHYLSKASPARGR